MPYHTKVHHWKLAKLIVKITTAGGVDGTPFSHHKFHVRHRLLRDAGWLKMHSINISPRPANNEFYGPVYRQLPGRQEGKKPISDSPHPVQKNGCLPNIDLA
jgi:hypothetical protein